MTLGGAIVSYIIFGIAFLICLISFILECIKGDGSGIHDSIVDGIFFLAPLIFITVIVCTQGVY